MAILELFRESGGNKIYKPWYHLVLKKYKFEKLFCPQDFEKLFPEIKLEPGEHKKVRVDISFID